MRGQIPRRETKERSIEYRGVCGRGAKKWDRTVEEQSVASREAGLWGQGGIGLLALHSRPTLHY